MTTPLRNAHYLLLAIWVAVLPTASARGPEGKRGGEGIRPTAYGREGEVWETQRRELQREIDTLQERLDALRARFIQLQVDAAYTQARAREWQRQQFFDVARQRDTLTLYNAPTFLWSPQVLERRYNTEWRRYAKLHAEAARVNYEGMCVMVRLREKYRQWSLLMHDLAKAERGYSRPVPRPEESLRGSYPPDSTTVCRAGLRFH